MSHTTSIKTSPITSVNALRRAVESLKAQGVNLTLEQNAIPRMYYNDQMAKHVKSKQDAAKHLGQEHAGLKFHQNPEECDFVLRVNDAYYDIGFIYNKDNELVPFFDDYNSHSFQVPATQKGKGPIRKYLGAAFDGKVEHWSGEREAGERELHSLGRFLQSYSIEVVREYAENEGAQIGEITTDEKGAVHVEILVD
jgi:hypothetical protein